ncbi:unknown [Clostridium sp. CAG:505]|nr:unknown [Clostridium sp. CAG:505]
MIAYGNVNNDHNRGKILQDCCRSGVGMSNGKKIPYCVNNIPIKLNNNMSFASFLFFQMLKISFPLRQ